MSPQLQQTNSSKTFVVNISEVFPCPFVGLPAVVLSGYRRLLYFATRYHEDTPEKAAQDLAAILKLELNSSEVPSKDSLKSVVERCADLDVVVVGDPPDCASVLQNYFAEESLKLRRKRQQEATTWIDLDAWKLNP